jgi:hypothetical protein
MSIADLIKAVEVGATPSVNVPIIHAVFSDPQHIKWACQILDGGFEAMSAAKALHDALLPGWAWWHPANDWTPDSVAVQSPHWQEAKSEDPDSGGYPRFVGVAERHPARAWLLAILRALEAEERG